MSSRKRLPRVCPMCGDIYQPCFAKQQTCSPSCGASRAWQNERPARMAGLEKAQRANYARYAERVRVEIDGLIAGREMVSAEDVRRLLVTQRARWYNAGWRAHWQATKRRTAA